ncbi:hypothetical protein EYF80_054760 [Liparis tanakae]|uniref:Uncharacterized protein n=1 Tax=Liparis tanakae TaxID=230148 RepID=A0A4Z2F2U7_9TELE|nr:hypothetical protein EYF80_054760 [Liparis tanakae]
MGCSEYTKSASSEGRMENRGARGLAETLHDTAPTPSCGAPRVEPRREPERGSAPVQWEPVVNKPCFPSHRTLRYASTSDWASVSTETLAAA